MLTADQVVHACQQCGLTDPQITGTGFVCTSTGALLDDVLMDGVWQVLTLERESLGRTGDYDELVAILNENKEKL